MSTETQSSIPPLTEPPVTEMVLALQFKPHNHLTSGHLGAFWHRYREEWTGGTTEAPLLDQTVEPFGEAAMLLGLPFGVRVAPVGTRLRLVSADQSEMLQLQNGWICFNWQRAGTSTYPGYLQIRMSLFRWLGRFSEYLRESGFPAIVPNLWEVTYVNHIPTGSDWTSAHMTSSLLGKVLSPFQMEGANIEHFNQAVSHTVDNQCRIRTTLQSAQVRTAEQQLMNVLAMTISARGPINGDPSDETIGERLDFGHQYVNLLFNSMNRPGCER
jgi:uncharacterized protein (TIGR04255 family)